MRVWAVDTLLLHSRSRCHQAHEQSVAWSTSGPGATLPNDSARGNHGWFPMLGPVPQRVGQWEEGCACGLELPYPLGPTVPASAGARPGCPRTEVFNQGVHLLPGPGQTQGQKSFTPSSGRPQRADCITTAVLSCPILDLPLSWVFMSTHV